MSATLILTISPEDNSDTEQLDTDARHLREQLEEADVGSIHSPEKLPPAGAKTGAAVDVGTLLVTLAASGGVLTTIIGTIQNWFLQHRNNTVTLELGGDKLILSGASVADQHELIKQWLERHR